MEENDLSKSDSEVLKLLGEDYYNKNDYHNAYKCFYEIMRRSEEKLTPYCEFMMGLIYYKTNIIQGINFIKSSSKKNCREAMYWLGRVYLEGTYKQILGENTKKGIKLLKKSANLNYKEANEFLSIYYSNNKNYQQAFHYATKAIEYGSVKSKFILGNLYYNGLSCRPNKEKGLEFLKEAADNNVVEAMQYLMYISQEENNNVNTKYYCEKLIKYIPKINKIFKEKYGETNKYYESVLGISYYTLSRMYENGNDAVQRDMVQARYYLLKSAQLGNQNAINLLGVMIAQQRQRLQATVESAREMSRSNRKAM